MIENDLGLMDLIIDNQLDESVYHILEEKKLLRVLDHTRKLVDLVVSSASKYEVNPDQARIAALLHDISEIVPKDLRVIYCQKNHIGLNREEVIMPILAHQKISAFLAKTYFNVVDEKILGAIACHTTLKEEANKLDLLIFVMDKIAWDQDGEPPYLALLEDSLEESLEVAAYNYMSYMLDHNLLDLVHPNFRKAYKQLEIKIENI